VNESKTPWFVLNTPELGRPLQDFYQACEEMGVLSKKTKELLMLALAAAFRCECRVKKYMESATEAGASREEIIETLLITAAEIAKTQLDSEEELFLK
jgi:AhpD family alkylhydroperoxidase